MPKILIFLLCVTILSCKKSETQIETITSESSSIQKYVEEVNKIRAKGCNCGTNYYPPAQSIVWNKTLEKAAIFHSQDMFSNKYFSHTSPKGNGPAERILSYGYNYSAFGENIFSSTGFSPDEEYVITSWKNSPSHCVNLMNPAFKEMAVGKYENYWTQLLASK